ncbi:MAG: nitrate reductase subunit alpha [Syntrophobacteraceae bacterium]|nr:nitrate reductase subunit alpha [Syntrophobacteraceae bacterium]
MQRENLISLLRFFKPRARRESAKKEKLAGGWAEVRTGGRSWEDYHRRRWQYDKVVRSTHGVNCTGSCSWNVYVKDGIIVWETQRGDYPGCGEESPDYEPRGCPRGATFSWYAYSPLRVKYPYIRSELLQMWREALESHDDPVATWRSIVEDPVKARKYRRARGKGGLVRVSWEEATNLVAASLVYTIQKYGPDRIFGFTPIPAMSMVCYASGARFLSLIGASMVSFYDWYCDLPPASPQIWGDQTDVPVSGDWFNATYMIVWGTNLPMTRTPDAHFYTEARYRGAKVAAVAPDYAEYVKFADTWLPAKAGTDGALAMAMVFVIFKEFYIDRAAPYFTDYARRYTDLPFVVMLRKQDGRYVSDRFLRASDLHPDLSRGDWKTVVYDGATDSYVVPNGSIGFRWEENGKWNIHLEDSASGAAIEPALSFAEDSAQWVSVGFPLFEKSAAGVREGSVPVKRIDVRGEQILVTTVFDLMAGNLGVDRGHGGDCARDYDDPVAYTPAWQEKITGVSRDDVIRVAREFAHNAEITRGRSMIFLGAGTNHWYHSDMSYRTIISLTELCGCQGVNGGGWAHYVGQEKVRPLAGWTNVAFGLDWLRPPRQHNGTSFFYFATDQWRYENIDPANFVSPLYGQHEAKHLADYNVLAARLGWLPSYPQFDRNPLDICREAMENGAHSDEQIVQYATEKLKSGDLKFAIEDPAEPANYPRLLFLWRSNLLGASGKGHEYFLKHLLGTENALLNEENEQSAGPCEMKSKPADPDGKLDLLVTLEIRMNTSALYSDVVLPAATWYEMHDISTTDLHPFIHPFNPAVEPAWETKTNWEQFKAIAKRFSELAQQHLGVQKDLVATPLAHDSPAELAQPLGKVKDWKKGETEAIPGETMPKLQVVTRDFPNSFKMMTSLGPLVEKVGIGVKGVSWQSGEEYRRLKDILGTVRAEGISRGLPDLDSARQVAETILTLSPETNPQVAARAWKSLERRTGLDLSHFGCGQGESLRFADIDAQPRKVLTTPTWSGVEGETRSYSPFVINIEEKIPFRTLTGRAQFYQDHEWMLAFGEGLPLFRPPLDMQLLGSTRVDHLRKQGKDLVLNYLTPHSKWSIHSTYSDTLTMLTLFRGGEAIWINNEDATLIDVKDNDWVECFNVNGVVMAKAVVSHRIPRGKAFMYHAQERLINTPGSNISKQRGGTHNSVTRIFMKPTQMIGGYAHLSYGFNYYGPTGAQRDEVVVVRKAGEVEWYED